MPQISLNHGSAAVVLALCEIYKGGAMNVVEHYRALIENESPRVLWRPFGLS